MFMLLGCWFYKSSRGSGKSLTWSDLEQSQTGSKNLLTQTSMAGSLNTKQLNLLVLLRFALMSLLWSGHPWKQLSKSLVTVVVVSNSRTSLPQHHYLKSFHVGNDKPGMSVALTTH